MSKHYVLMRDIITKYHPEFTKSADLTQYGLSNPEIFNVERLVEECLAHVGGYNFVDEYGRDFDDPVSSDSKTTSVVVNNVERNRYVFIIQNVETKIGALRVTIYNPFKDRVDFMYLPKHAVNYWKERNGASGNSMTQKERIRTSWSPFEDHYNKLEEYRVSSFEELATKML